MLLGKKVARLRRMRKTRIRLKQLCKLRLCVHRTSMHIYAQIISGDCSRILVSASTLDKSVRKECSYGGNVKAAMVVGKAIANLAMQKNIRVVSFDRSGFKYHGRVKSLADSARAHGLEF